MKSLYNLNRQKNTTVTGINDGYSGFEKLQEIVSAYMEAAENSHDALIATAEALVKDLQKLTRPYSNIRANGYTHLIKTFSYEDRTKDVVVGWGKYYGRMVENGTSKMAARRHLEPLFRANQEKYYKIMLTTVGIKNW